jgi:quinone-modifying oxidoreductase subunit QmoB
MDDAKPSVYVCTGCGIGEALDAERLCASVQEEFGISATQHPILCSPEGVAALSQDEGGEGVRRVVIAACSPRAKTEEFSLGSTLVERVNLREQVAWSHAPNDEDTQALAEDQLRMGIIRIQKSEPPDPPEGIPERTVLVIGGGISGMTAALGAAEAGRDVILIEEKPTLGGWLARFQQISPTRSPYRDLEAPPLEETMAAIENHSRVKVLTSTRVAKVEGQPGAFQVSAVQDGTSTDLGVGSIVLATGWEPYDATKLTHLGFGQSPNIVTSVTLEEMVKENRLVRPSDGGPLRNVVFVQCAGSRDDNHLPYCSSVCCLVSLKQALYVRQAHPDANVYVLHKDIRTPGQYEDFYKRVQEDEGVFFLRAEVTGVADGSDGTLKVQAEHTPLGDAVQLEADLVVLAVGMEPKAAGALNLQYRQGPDLPVSPLGFPDSNFVCWPYETQRTGIFTAGCVREPMNVAASEEDATGAALRAVQSLRLLEQGEALHPRVGDPYFPSFFLQRCTQCKRCTEECPFGALDEDEKGTPQVNPNRCRRCGVCMGACPERLVSFKNYSVDQLASAIKSISVPEEEEKLRVLALVCENDAYPALDMAGARRSMIDPSVRVLPMRCLGSTNVVFIADAMSRGIDGVILLGCRYGDDYQCHFIQGSELANRRMDNVKETLSRLRLEPERVKLVQVAIDDYDKLPQILNEFADELRAMGPNPYKGF